MYFDQMNKQNKCKSNLCRSWVCGRLSPESCLSQAGSTFPIEDVPEGPQREFVELSRAVSAYSPKTSLLLEAKQLRHVLKDKPHVLNSLAHMTAIVGGPVLSEVSDVNDEVRAWLELNEANGSMFALGDVSGTGELSFIIEENDDEAEEDLQNDEYDDALNVNSLNVMGTSTGSESTVLSVTDAEERNTRMEAELSDMREQLESSRLLLIQATENQRAAEVSSIVAAASPRFDDNSHSPNPSLDPPIRLTDIANVTPKRLLRSMLSRLPSATPATCTPASAALTNTRQPRFTPTTDSIPEENADSSSGGGSHHPLLDRAHRSRHRGCRVGEAHHQVQASQEEHEQVQPATPSCQVHAVKHDVQ